jgi:ferric-dicitrate binding protein FerR (iron transport regulator)
MKSTLPLEIIFSKLRGDISAQKLVEFNGWVEQSNNRELFGQLEQVWISAQYKTANYQPNINYYWNELSSRISKTSVEKTNNISTPSRTKNISLSNFYRTIAAASVLLILSFSVAYYLGGSVNTSQNQIQQYTSLTGKSKIILPDGTQVWLHQNSSISYNTNFDSKKREVRMTGEAYFNVTHNVDKPFVVHVKDAQVKVFGTEFNVNSVNETKDVLVSLYKGSVSMSVNNREVMLQPGDEGFYNSSARNLKVSKGDVEFAKIWTKDHLRFENKNLQYVCRYLSKWYGVDINIDSRTPNNQSYTFTLGVENLEEILRIMSRMSSINYEFNQNNQLRIFSKTGSPPTYL